MDRSNHYETAFEAYLRDRRLSYVAVDETRRTTADDQPLKSIDFLVHAENGRTLLVDVKGRQFVDSRPGRSGRSWQNWVMAEDVDALRRWQTLFGQSSIGLLVFVYDIADTIELKRGTPDLWYWKGRRYLIRGVAVDDYRNHVRVRSPNWGTVHLGTAVFRDLVRPLREWTHPDLFATVN